jgi:predicted ATPase
MRLEHLRVGAFKNLRDCRIDFATDSPYTVFVGENGAGKSNVLEALSAIFQHLDLEARAPFEYSMRYHCRGRDIAIEARAEEYPSVSVREPGAREHVALPRRQFLEDDAEGRPKYRPAFVFGYYSGPSDRLASQYAKHRERFYEWIIRPPERRARAIADPNALRRLFYAENLHGQFALIAFFMESESSASGDQAFLREHLQIDGLDSVLFALRRPPWRRPKGQGDERFWRAVGEVQQFLAKLYDAAFLPMRMPRRIKVDLTKNPSVENLYLFLQDADALEAVYQSYDSQYAFFTALESMHLSKLLAEVRTRVRMTPGAGGGEVTYRDLSEGEQQLLLVLGLLKFTAREEALFLLDEPDTHLNPAWSIQYLDFLDRFIVGRASCHVVMATHDPLVFAGLTAAQVRLFRRDETGCSQVEAPTQDPRGMGIQAILASDLFRLPAGGLDRQTLESLERQRELASREGDLSVAERQELREINDRLNARDFWKSDPDPLYQLFLKHFVPRWTEAARANGIRPGPKLTLEERRARDEVASALADEIAAELAAEQREE